MCAVHVSEGRRLVFRGQLEAYERNKYTRYSTLLQTIFTFNSWEYLAQTVQHDNQVCHAPLHSEALTAVHSVA